MRQSAWFRVVLAVALAAPAVSAQSWIEQAVLVAPAPGDDDWLGESVSIWGDTAAVGAPQRDSGGGPGSGAVLLFERDAGGPGAWGQVLELAAPEPQSRFGCAVALSGDTLVVGAYRDGSLSLDGGAAYVFERNLGGADAWGQAARLWASDGTPGDWFGWDVAVEGDTIVAGAVYAGVGNFEPGAAYVFGRDQGGAGAWGEAAHLTAVDGYPGDFFGDAVAVWGDTVVVGALREEDNFQGVVAGLAYDPLGGILYGSDITSDQLVVVDPATNTTAPVGALGFASVRGLAFDPNRNTLYGSDVDTDLLIAIDPSTGAGTAVGALGFSQVEGLAFDPVTDTLYGVDSLSDELVTIDTSTGAGAVVGDLSFNVVRGLALDPASGGLYATDMNLGVLIAVDPVTGLGAEIGPYGISDKVQALAIEPAATSLHGAAIDLDYVTLDAITGQATAYLRQDAGAAYLYARDTGGLGAWGLVHKFRDEQGESFDSFGASVAIEGDMLVVGAERADGFQPDSGVVYVFERDEGGPGAWGEVQRLFSTHPSSAPEYFGGAVALSGDTLLVGAEHHPSGSGAPGAAYLFERGLLGAPPWSALQQLGASDAELGHQFGHAVSIQAGTALVGAPMQKLAEPGAAYLFDEQAIVSYCTAGLSAGGCRALLSASGAASATAASGFDLTAAGVEGGRNGLFFFGTNGRQAVPWGSGSSYQCVTPPTTRAGALSGSGTTGLCDGAFAQDLNALWCPTCPRSPVNPGAGAVVQAQLWYRDPGNTSNQTTSLSDAIEVTVAP